MFACSAHVLNTGDGANHKIQRGYSTLYFYVCYQSFTLKNHIRVQPHLEIYSFVGTALQVRYLYGIFVFTDESLMHQVTNSWKVAM